MANLTSRELDLLRSYTSGPKIWDATALLPLVYTLSDKGLIEPAEDRSTYCYQLTTAGRQYLNQEGTHDER